MVRRRAVSVEGELRTRRERRLVELRERREQKKQGRATARAIASGVLTVGAVLASGDPAAAATFPVINTNDAGAGSLRDAITLANAAAGADDITFTLPPTSTISLLSALPQIANASLTITGPGAANLTIRRDPAAATNFRIFDIGVTALPAVTITGVTLTGGNPAATGGAINVVGVAAQTVTVADSVITGNTVTVGDGGGIRVGTTTALTVQRTVISGNTSADGGGGIYLFNNNPLILEDSTISGNTGGGTSSEGGGLYLFGTATFAIRGTTFSGNSTPAGATSLGGGGLFIGGGTPVVNIENSTFSGNTSAVSGGAILKNATTTGTVNITHSTITLNTASGAAGTGGGGLFFPTGFANLTIRNSIVSGNTNANTPDISAGTINVNFSAIGSATGWTPSGTSGNNLAFGTNLQLGPLANNGGPTQTHNPGPNTPCVNAGDPAFVPPPNFDQRGAGFPRVIGGIIDIGGVERNPVPVEGQEFTIE